MYNRRNVISKSAPLGKRMAKRKERLTKSLSQGVAWRNKSDKHRTDSRKAALIAATCMQNGPSNKKFAKSDEAFRKACEKVETKPTARQASKFRNKTGKAYLKSK